jgi:hypothetical protein
MAPLSPPVADMAIPPSLPSYRQFQTGEERSSKVQHDREAEGFAVDVAPSAMGPTKSLKGGTHADLDPTMTRKERLSALQQRAQERVQRRREEQMKQQE